MDNYTLTFSFDIGHSSIGWSVLTQTRPDPEILGCGSVIFPKDDCLAAQRRDHRRTRRNIRATRQRISRMRSLLLHLGVLDARQLDKSGHPAPHVLAARSLLKKGHPGLSWIEIWNVLRWYAHNRGYDGNSRWARNIDEHTDDTEKEKAAHSLMRKHGTNTMAETICAVLGIDPRGKKVSSHQPFKTLNAAFPRQTVRAEVLAILQSHAGHLPKLDQKFIDCLIAGDEKTGHRAWRAIEVPDIRLPKRYFGGLLFGQLIPRFDNRIIATCPISGQKVPDKATIEFLRYRWSMIVANIKADGEPLPVSVRQRLHARMEAAGRLTAAELRKEVELLTGTSDTNIETYFELHPDSADALILDPALALFNGHGRGSKALAPFWGHLTEHSRRRACGRWKKGRQVNLEWMLADCRRESGDPAALTAEVDKAFAEDQKKNRSSYLTREHLLRKSFAPDSPSGRSPHSRRTMIKVFDFVFSTDRHPTEAGGEDRPAGPIYRSKEIQNRERDLNIGDLTNNHLIRQRLTILLRLVNDMVTEFADGDSKRVRDIVVEVARDLQQYSGLTAKKMAGEITKRLSHFKSAVKHLQDNVPEIPLNGSLIRKCRIAMDLDWKCPFTGKKYCAAELPGMEREHIIPFADRPTNSLDALVITFDWVNKLKGKRTALSFIKEVAGDSRFHTPKQYVKFVEKLKMVNKVSYPDDFRRQTRRKKWLMVENYEKKDHGFTAGALTQTSHLNRLSARQLEKRFVDPVTGDCTVHIHSLPGQVTAETRYHWRLLHTLDTACPECAGKNKTEIRDITHLHHALDACTAGLVAHYLPGTLPRQAKNQKGTIWQAMLERRQSEDDVALLMGTGIFSTTSSNGGVPKAQLRDLPSSLKNELSERLAECRVVQHVPADMSGAKLELNPWRVSHIDGDSNDPLTVVTLQQRVSSVEKGKRIIVKKETTEKAGKLIGLRSGKLKKNSSVLVLSDNYGVAIDPSPAVIPFHSVPKRLKELRAENEGKDVRVLRNGMIIRISHIPGKNGLWRIFSAKAPAHLDIGRLDVTTIKSKGERYWRQVSVVSLLEKRALEILSPPLTGISAKKHQLPIQ